MEFWGVEVKSGQPLRINPGDNKLVHLSQASLGEVKIDKGKEPVCLYLKLDDKKLVLGTLSLEKFPQLSLDLVVHKDFELSHNWKNGSVYFAGYKVSKDEGNDSEDDSSDSDEDVKSTLPITDNGNHDLVTKTVSQNANAGKLEGSAAKQNMKGVKSNQKADDGDSDDSDSDNSYADDEDTSDDEVPNQITPGNEDDEESDDDDEETDESESDEEDEETPKKAEPSKKRPAESSHTVPVPDKKAKFVTPEKSGGKKGVSHPPTPHPSKQAGKTPANSDQTKKLAQQSGGNFPCKSCNRSFTTEMGLQAHTKAKHSTAA